MKIMSQTQNFLFPLILDTLSNKPSLAETETNLLEDLNEKLIREGVVVQNLKKEVGTMIDLGKNLGLLTVQDEKIRMPFRLKNFKDVGWIRSVIDEEASGGEVLESDSIIRRKSEKDKFRKRRRGRSRRRISRRRRHPYRRRKEAPRPVPLRFRKGQ